MSDSFNSPNQLSLEKSQESTPEPNVAAVNAQQVVAPSSSLEGPEDDDFGDLEAITSSDDKVNADEEASFEVIADYIEAEVGATAVASSLEVSEESMAAEDQGEASLDEAISDFSADIKAEEETVEGNALDVDGILSATADAEFNESLNTSGSDTVNEVEVYDVEETVESHGDDVLEADEASLTALEADDIEIDSEEDSEELTESFTAPVEVVDVEIWDSQEQEDRSYEVHQDGTLTYFQYFLDEEDSAFGPGSGDWRGETVSSSRSFASATAVGVGVLAATFGAGLLMAEATNRNSISENQEGSFEAQAKADAERKASEASELAKASSPETTTPDWSATQKAIAVSQGSAQANPALGSVVSPSASSVTSKLAPLAQSWGASVPLPAPSLPIVSPPVITTASLPTPTVAPVDLSALQPVPSYQVIQPPSSTASSTPLPAPPPVVAAVSQDEQQLRSRMSALRDRMSEPIQSDGVPVSTDGTLLDGPDERWVGNVPSRVNVPLNQDGTTLDSAFQSPELPSLTDSPYSNPSVASTPAVMSPSTASVNTATPTPIAAAPQASPLHLAPVVPPHQASSLDEKVVAPVAGLLPTPVVPAQSEPLSPRASATPANTAAQATPAVRPANNTTDTNPEMISMEVTPGAIALEVIPPAVSTPVLTSVPAATTPANATEVDVAKAAIQPATAPVAETKKLSQGITSLTELTDIQSPRPLALSRDTARAALANAEKLDQFRVLPLTVGEYQRLWQESGNDGTFAPVHGFVDYGQNVIAVVVTRGEASTVGSAAKDSNRLQPIDEVKAPTLTEVSAQPLAPVAAVSQS